MDITPSPFLTYSRVYFIAFGVVSMIGGVIGFVKARSWASLIAGDAAGILLVAGGILLGFPRPLLTMGAALALFISLALLGRFLPSLLRGKMNPAAYLTPLSAVGSVLGVIILLGILSPD